MGRYLETAVLLVLVLGLAGCSGTTPGVETSVNSSPAPTASVPLDSTPTTTSTATQPSPIETTRGPATGTKWTVMITRVIDGDTVEAEFPNGEVDTLRLLGVDTPETTLSRVSPDEFEGIPDSTAGRDHLFNWGEKATDFAREELAGQTVRIEVDPTADRRGYYGRLLVYVYVDGENFNKRLLSEGYARLYESEFRLSDEFEAAESNARENAVGLWDFVAATPSPTPMTDGGTPGSLVVQEIHADAVGNDLENLNDEYVVFRNDGDSSLAMSGWTVADEADHTYTVPSGFALEPGATVTLHTGNGSESTSELYWGSDSAIWNNGGDTITVRTEDGALVFEQAYG